MRTIVLDTETTGLSPNKGDRVVEIGCVEIIQRRASEHHFHVYINPERDMPEEAYRVHGLSAEFLATKPIFADIANDFLQFIQGAQLIIHNAPFDVGFLNAELARIGAADLEQQVASVTDTLALAKAQFSGKRNSLDALCQRFNINTAHRELHGGLKDAQLLAEVYFALTSGQQSILMSADKQAEAVPIRIPENMRVQLASAEELAAHEAILGEMEKNSKRVWID